MKLQHHPPQPGEESVWDYPRPPAVEDTKRYVRVFAGGYLLAESRRAKRVLETSHPPVYYLPPSDIDVECLAESGYQTWCEWKGTAHYYSVIVPGRCISQAAWYYPDPTPPFAELAGYVAFYPSKMDVCYVDNHRVVAQKGDFYGGWITPEIVGPFKGPRGTEGW